ncbi:nucleoporin Nup186/Nup192/Nup205 [Armillaria novae-zelandiae]|uniref:Nucleoporin Nup186/Nup192/Nup205 n=1 Tax=Armillaria novae-zelandiae TaxID=153914 RepID=A0AA39P781_9AGAR|nr:nucleoporin Nup186/Nup192/Nup205 [Armillaria novae-zelandiae]
MESISRLRQALFDTFSGKHVANGGQALLDELMVAKPRLLKLFDVGARNQQEQKEIESGKALINGKQVAVNAEFARQVIFLSQELECSERYIAGLLQKVVTENPNVGPVDSIELAISEYHQRRRHLVDSLRYIYEATIAEAPDATLVYSQIHRFVREELQGLGSQGVENSLSLKIVKEFGALDTALSKTDAARKSARSNTVAPSAQGTGSLGADILNARFLPPSGIMRVVEWLFSNPSHPITYYMLATILAAFDPADPKSFANDATTVSYMKQKLGPSTIWKEPGLKATVLLKHRNPNIEHRDGFKTDQLEAQIWSAVQGDCFAYLAAALIHLERKQGSSSVPSLLTSITLTTEQVEQRDLPTDDFKPTVLNAFETLIRSLLTHASSELRKIKQRQEDVVLSSARTDRTRGNHSRFSTAAPEPTASPRNDIGMLYSLIGILYSSLPAESALQFWGSGPTVDSARTSYMEYLESTAGKLPAFLQWAVWSTPVHDATMMMALYDMLAGLAKGQQSSELAYNFLARGGGEVIQGSTLPSSSTSGSTLSWATVFDVLDTWASSANTSRTQPVQPLGQSLFGAPAPMPPPPPAQQPVITPKDVLLAQSFLRLLSTVVTFSISVRVAISSHVHFRAIPTLVSLLPLSIPLELKGALFEALSAFCRPGAGPAGVEICRTVWTMMERLEVINVRTSLQVGFGTGLLPTKGVEVELEEIEAAHGLYPATIPFLQLLSTLIHTSRRVSLTDRIIDSGTSGTIPETLGQPYRLPGISPFVGFVIDNVFAKIPMREYLRPSDRWKMNNLCLCFIERCLASFDLESLLAAAENGQLKGDVLLPLLIHPGYDVMNRMLTSSGLQRSILSYVVEGVEGFDKGFAGEEYFFANTIVRVLRIVHRILEIQDIFLDVLIPLLSDFEGASSVGTIHPRSYFTKFDQSLSFSPQYIPALASYVAYPAYPELVLLSVRIIGILSSSTSLPNLAILIEQSNNSERILAGFMSILETESTEDVIAAEAATEQTTGAGAPDMDDALDLSQATRLAILELLIQNTQSTQSHLNIAHFLLFGSTKKDQQIQDPHALGAQKTCVHVILDLLNAGVPRLKGKGKDREFAPFAAPMFIRLPALAERCYRIIYQLSADRATAEFTMRYLRTREDFFARHLAAVPSKAPEALADPFIEVLYGDGSRVTATVSSFSSFLRSRSWIFDLVALELHVLSSKNNQKGIAELLSILFGSEPTYDNRADWEDGMLRTFHEVGQSHMRIIEFLQSLAFDWRDSLTVEHIELKFLGQLNLQACARKDVSGCEIIDRSALLVLLNTARRALYSRNAVMAAADASQLALESAYVLESCAVENHRREIVHATATGFESWRRMLDMTLTKCFHRLPHDHRENMLFDLLHVLPSIIRSSDLQESTAVLLAEMTLSAITKLREDRHHQVILQTVAGDHEASSLPAERLYAILTNILECILENSHVELVRGNLYASIVNYPQLPHSAFLALSMSTSLSSSLTASTRDNFLGNSISVTLPGQTNSSTSPIQMNSLSLMKGHLERLVTMISRDAIDGTEVWKTVAFMLLTSLCQLSAAEKQYSVLLCLVRHGILSNFVHGVAESDLLLQSVLKPDPDDLNALYVYESKMSLFIRIAQSRIGAERLLEANVVSVLAQSDFLDARPEGDQAFIDQDSFLPSAVQRYHQLFMPALELVNAVVAVLGSKHSSASNQALDFLSMHSPTIVILLKNEIDDISLSLLEEIHLLVSLCTNMLPLVPKTELASTNSGFGAIHAAILSLSTRCLGTGRWTQDVRPITDAEMLSASVLSSGFSSETRFDVNVRQKERLLRKALVAYIGSASEFTEPEINEDRGSHFIATLPTLGDAIEALNGVYNDLAETLKQISDISAELAMKDHIGVENIEEVIRSSDTEIIRDLDVAQKRSLICRELEHMRDDLQDDVKTAIHTTEMILLLLWRHMLYYCDETRTKSSEKAYAIRLLSMPDPQSVRQDVGNKLRPVLQRLKSLVGPSLLGKEWRDNQAYIEIMDRRLRDTAGLHDINADEMDY